MAVESEVISTNNQSTESTDGGGCLKFYRPLKLIRIYLVNTKKNTHKQYSLLYLVRPRLGLHVFRDDSRAYDCGILVASHSSGGFAQFYRLNEGVLPKIKHAVPQHKMHSSFFSGPNRILEKLFFFFLSFFSHCDINPL